MSVEQDIRDKLTMLLSPHYLEVVNESDSHHVAANSETHFKVTIVADDFNDKTLIARHRCINTALAEEFAGELHALALHTYTPSEWDVRVSVPCSPKCHG